MIAEILIKNYPRRIHATGVSDRRLAQAATGERTRFFSTSSLNLLNLSSATPVSGVFMQMFPLPIASETAAEAW